MNNTYGFDQNTSAAGILIYGSTGSIGLNTLSVIEQHPDRFRIVALTAHSQVQRMFEQCLKYHPDYVVLTQEAAAIQLRMRLKEAQQTIEVLSGTNALQELAYLAQVDIVVAAIVGSAGLLPTLAAIRAKKRVLLANKEALVMAGQFFMDALRHYQTILLPVDSEHNAIFQCLPDGFRCGNQPEGVERIILTASGGALRDLPIRALEHATPQQACQHPTWIMGSKISVDSATLMNKGFELIEAYWLFNLSLSKIEILIHPQSVIHSLVGYLDGSLLAQLANPDMRIPIAYCLAWPQRIAHRVPACDLLAYGKLEFKAVDTRRYPCLNLAYEAIRIGGNAATILNAANEVAVQAFLDQRIVFTQIAQINQTVLERLPYREISELELILEEDRLARETALSILAQQFSVV